MKSSSFLYLPAFILTICSQQLTAQQLPIKPARTIEFNTDEGSYIDLDISPDGRTIVFGLLGDLYTVPATGGKASQLTHGMALKTSPVFAPDGKKIAYNSDRTGDSRITVLDLKSGALQTVDPGHSHWFQRLLWSPNSRSVIAGNTAYMLSGGSQAFKSDVLRFSADGQDFYSISADTLYRVHLPTDSGTAFAILPAPFPFNACLSPDARSLVYLADTAGGKCLIGLNLADHSSRILVRQLFKADYRGWFTPHYAFSPDSKSIYIAFKGKIHQIGVQNGEDRIIPFSADVKADLGKLDYNTFRVTHSPIKIRYTRSANASPDGKKLVFTALNRIYIMNLPKGKPKILVRQACSQYQPCWSPDGKWIAYISWCDTAGGYLWKVPAKGGKPIRLTSVAGEYQRPCWSPDSKAIAVIKGGSPASRDQRKLYARGGGIPRLGERDDIGIGQLQLVASNGNIVSPLVDSVPLWNQLSFSSDGSRLFYQPFFQNIGKTPYGALLVSTGVASKETKIAAIGQSGFFTEFNPSPDGNYMAFTLDEDLYLMRLNPGGDPVLVYDQEKGTRAIRIGDGVDPHWEQGGKVLSWSYANKFYRIAPGKVVRLAEQKDTTAIRPDQAVSLDLTAPQNYAHGTVVLKNVRIITMRGNQVIEQGTIVIRDGRFAAVGRSSAIKVPTGAKVIDLSGKTVIPGFVDLHLHMYLPPNVFPQQGWMYLINLAYGVTTARDPSSSYDSFGYSELLQTGHMLGPRLYSSGRAIRFGDGVSRFDGLQDAADVVAQRKTMGGTFMKQYALPTRMQHEWLLLASEAAVLNMTNEGGTMGWMQVLGMIKDGSSGVEHNPDWWDTYKDVTTFVANSGTYFTPTLQVTPEDHAAKQYFNRVYWHHPDAKLARFMLRDDAWFGPVGNGHESYKWITTGEPKDTTTAGFLYAAQVDARILHAGGRVTLGSHGNDEGIGVHNELWALQMGGISNMQALQAATIMGAEGLGIQKDVGSIEPGKIADLIILNSNPLDDIHNSRDIQYVMKDGVLYDGNTLDELWPLKRKCPQWRFNGSGANEPGTMQE